MRFCRRMKSIAKRQTLIVSVNSHDEGAQSDFLGSGQCWSTQEHPIDNNWSSAVSASVNQSVQF